MGPQLGFGKIVGFQIFPPEGSLLLTLPHPSIMVHDLIDWSTFCWDLSSISPHISPFEQTAIEAITISSSHVLDKLCWTSEKTGMFSVRSVYHLRHSHLHGSGYKGQSSLSPYCHLAFMLSLRSTSWVNWTCSFPLSMGYSNMVCSFFGVSCSFVSPYIAG